MTPLVFEEFGMFFVKSLLFIKQLIENENFRQDLLDKFKKSLYKP